MENKYHNIDEIFRNSLDNYSADPPAHVWENIDSALDKMDGKRKSRFMWFMGSFLAIATTFVGGYYLSGYLAGNTREIAAPENSMIKIRTVLLVDATIDADKMKMKLGEKMSLISGMQNSVVNNDGNDLTQPVSNNSITNVNLNSRTGSTRNNGHTTVTRGGARHNNGNSILPGQDYSVRDQGGVHSSSVTPSTNLGQQNIIRNDKGYFGSSNVTHDNSTKPVTTEPADSLKKNGQLNGSSSKPQSYYVDPKSLNDAQKLALAKENKEENVETPVAKNDNFTGSPVNITGNENNVKEEDLSYLSPSYPIITVLPYFAPMYTFQNSSNDDNAYSPVFGSNGNFDEKPTFSWSSGVMLGYNFTERLTVFIG
jgi:hypothetical protein